jgi:hypothetical protein
VHIAISAALCGNDMLLASVAVIIVLQLLSRHIKASQGEAATGACQTAPS